MNCCWRLWLQIRYLPRFFRTYLKKRIFLLFADSTAQALILKFWQAPAAAPDYIYVSSDDFERAKELYEAYLTTEAETEFLDFSE